VCGRAGAPARGRGEYALDVGRVHDDEARAALASLLQKLGTMKLFNVVGAVSGELSRRSLAVAAVLAVSGSTSAVADPRPDAPRIVVPAGCTPPVERELAGPNAWGKVLSFTACTQDATVARVDRAEQLEPLVEQMQAALEPTLGLYAIAMEHGPAPVKLQASYQIAASLVALMTRARMSIVAPPDLKTNAAAAARYVALHEQLEPLLDRHAKLALALLEMIDQAVANDPQIAPDAVTRKMVRSAHQLALILDKRPSAPDTEPLQAGIKD
jgi:hypothetical protein